MILTRLPGALPGLQRKSAHPDGQGSKRGRRRPDPLVTVTDDLRSWFEADPGQTGSELLLRLQTADPDRYPDVLLRMVQRRLKIWRSEIASQLVFACVLDCALAMAAFEDPEQAFTPSGQKIAVGEKPSCICTRWRRA